MVRRRLLAPAVPAALAALALAASGCGGESSAGSKGPIKIAWMGAESGEYATKDRHYAIDLAVADINSKGGIGGRKIEYKAYDAGLTPEQGVTAVKKALSENPDAIIGLATTAQVKAAAPLLKTAGIPTLHNAQSHTLNHGALKVDGLFRFGPTESMQTQALADHIVKKVRPKRVGLMASTDEGSQEAAGMLRKGLAAGGITDIVERKVPHTATDLTEAVLALRGTDATITWSFPTIDSLFLRQRRQNGLTQPTFSDNSGGSILGNGLNTAAELAGYSYVIGCDPDLLDTPAARAYVSAWKAKYGPNPTNPQLAQGYDAIQMVAAAARQAGSTEHKALTSALEKIGHTGVCGTYKADDQHDLYHSDLVVDGSGGKTARKLRARYDNLQTRMD